MIHINLVANPNPGATQGDLARTTQRDHSLIVEKSMRNLNQENASFPHFFFDPELKETDGGKWFSKKYRWLIEATDRAAVARNVVTCELAPYHSVRWRNPKTMPPTQEFTYAIVRNAIERDATILLARTPKIWEQHVLELKTYPRVYRPNSINASVSPGNYLGAFNEIVKAISEG